MKKLLALILVITTLFSFAACGKKTEEAHVDDALIDVVKPETLVSSDAQEDKSKETEEKNDGKDKEDKKNESSDESKSDVKENSSQEQTSTNTKKEEGSKSETQNTQSQEQNSTSAPSNDKADSNKKPESNTKPPVNNREPVKLPQSEKPVEEQPSAAPEAEKPSKLTLGNTLLSDFKTIVGSGKSALEIAESLVNGPSIKFMGGAMPVEEGLLAGFDNYEVNGFKSGAMFAPMIGSIPFVGYVFELQNSSEASSFISGLKNNANLRWNICSEAEEMVTASSGNFVFFVMCPKSMEE